jgi:hypothetical protein
MNSEQNPIREGLIMRNQHHHLSREEFEEAITFAAAGEIELARTHLLVAAEHALADLADRHMLQLSHEDVHRDPASAAARLAEIGAAPADVAPVLRELDQRVDVAHDPNLAARLGTSFGSVQVLISGSVDAPARAATPGSPVTGGPKGALNRRGAETATLASIARAFRRPNSETAGITFSGGAKGALNVRGAEAATRALATLARAFRRSATEASGTPFSGGPKGALNRRGAEAAARAVHSH